MKTIVGIVLLFVIIMAWIGSIDGLRREGPKSAKPSWDPVVTSLITPTQRNGAKRADTNALVQEYIAESKTRVVEAMRDPDSARFRDVFFSGAGGIPVTCGWVNGRNGFGGHTGFREFVATAGKKGLILINDGSKVGRLLDEDLPAGSF